LIVLVVGLALGAILGAVQGSIVAYMNVPSFIVTLGGLLIWRGLAWLLASGRTIAPMDSIFQQLGGGASGSVGGTVSWILGVAGCMAIVLLVGSRDDLHRHPAPLWALRVLDRR
jgi:D-xylose transport system permease protein